MSDNLENYSVYRLGKPISSIAEELIAKLNLSTEDAEKAKQLLKDWEDKHVQSYLDYWPGA